MLIDSKRNKDRATLSAESGMSDIFIGKTYSYQMVNRKLRELSKLNTIELKTTTPATPLNDAHPGGFLFGFSIKVV